MLLNTTKCLYTCLASLKEFLFVNKEGERERENRQMVLKLMQNNLTFSLTFYYFSKLRIAALIESMLPKFCIERIIKRFL